MLDPRYVADNLDEVRARLETRSEKWGPVVSELSDLVEQRRGFVHETEKLAARRNAANKEMSALAKGGDKAVLLTDADWMSRDARATAKALAAQIQQLDAKLVFMGRVATDRDNAAVGPMVATYLGWPCVTDVVGFSLEGETATARCETDAGVETYSIQLPAVITCNKGLNEPRYAGLKGIMAAKKKPLEEVATEVEANIAQIEAVELPPERKEGRIVGEGVDAVPALIEALKNEAQVL